MKRVFLSFNFGDADRELVNQVDQLLASHDVMPVTGKVLGGGPLTPTIQKFIEGSDGLIALLTQRDRVARNRYRTHQWVLDELNHARTNKMRTISLVETGVEVGGMFAAYEYIPFDRQNPLPAFLRLSEVVGQWKREVGRSIKVLVLPPTLAQQVGQGAIKCRYRLNTRDGKWMPWRETEPVPGVGGTFVNVAGVGEDDAIQLEFKLQNKKWQSIAAPQWVQIELSQV